MEFDNFKTWNLLERKIIKVKRMLAKSCWSCLRWWNSQDYDGKHRNKSVCRIKAFRADQRRNSSGVRIINRAIKQTFNVHLRRFQ